ncbi:MAG: M12 family metallo-peptidase [Phycisphaerales bacterium]|nr:M12 family metallo-peptidase [Phycisphaerales bacterium]
MPFRLILVIALACGLSRQALQAQTIKQHDGTTSSIIHQVDTPPSQVILDPVLSGAVNEAFELAASDLVTLDVPVTPENAFTTLIPVDNQVYTMELAPHSVRSSKYRLLVQVEDGSIVEQAPGPIRTLRGKLTELEGSLVAGTLSETGLQAMIILPDGSQRWVEPVARKIPSAAANQYVLYEAVDTLSEGGLCGTVNATATSNAEAVEAVGVARGTACGGTLCETELANDCDFQFFQDYGSVGNVESRVDFITNSVNAIYELDVQITHVITATIVRTAEPDPYSDENPIVSNSLLSQFRSQWLANHGDIERDVAQLFSGKNFVSPVIGQAWGIGRICTSGSYCINETDYNNNTTCAIALHAHELGHLWGAFHCSCSSNIMNSSNTCQDSFSTGSMNSITNHRNSRSCLMAVESETASLPFFDDFPSSTIDSAKWTGIDDAVINGLGINEPSGTLSLNLNGGSSTGGDEIRSGIMDLSLGVNTPVSYWYQRTGNDNSPESGEDLVIEYRTSTGSWAELNRHLGSGPDMTNYELVELTLPATAQHDRFRLRFRVISSNEGADDWFIDDVNIDLGDVTPPSPDPAEFAVLPPATVSDTEIEFQAVAAVDPSGVEYFFDKVFGPACCGTDSGWIASETYVADELLANSSYSYKVKARDTSPNQRETAISDLFATSSTFIETPFDIALVDAQETEITVIITCNDTGDSNRCVLGSFTNLFANPPSGLFLDMAPLAGSGSNTWTDQQTITVTGLTPGTDYTFKAKTRNRLSVETAFSGEFIFSTLGGGCPTVAGDLNQDGDVDGDDIAGYIRAKLGLAPEPGEEQNCADFGNGADLSAENAAFVAALLS